MPIMSLVTKIKELYHSRVNKRSFKIIILQSANPYRITPEETEELSELIKALNLGYKVQLADSTKQVGYGVTYWEILRIWLPTVIVAGGAIAANQIIQEVTKIAVQWARNRLIKKGTSKPPTYIAIYGPDGKVVKSVLVKSTDQEVEDRTEYDRKEQKKEKRLRRKPPLIEE